MVRVAAVMLSVASPAAFAEEAGHHALPHHHLAGFVGYGIERDSHNHGENGGALGLEYEVQFSESWGLGLDVEKLFGDTHRSWVAVIPLSFHANERWRFFGGPGWEFGDDHTKNLLRLGVAYEIPLQQRWTVSPEFLVDFLEGGANTYVFGIAIGHGF